MYIARLMNLKEIDVDCYKLLPLNFNENTYDRPALNFESIKPLHK